MVRRQAEEGRDFQDVSLLLVRGVLQRRVPVGGLARAQRPLQGEKEGKQGEIEGGSWINIIISSSSKSAS